MPELVVQAADEDVEPPRSPRRAIGSVLHATTQVLPATPGQHVAAHLGIRDDEYVSVAGGWRGKVGGGAKGVREDDAAAGGVEGVEGTGGINRPHEATRNDRRSGKTHRRPVPGRGKRRAAGV